MKNYGERIKELELQVKYYYAAYESEKTLCMKVMGQRDALKKTIQEHHTPHIQNVENCSMCRAIRDY